uniref:TSA: Tityus bahiensis Tbah02280 mRNA sequence n=1 Tax=Tityus bahiensis TaxID=50343 RepID=A0A0C9RFL4_TITBA
MFIFIFLMGIIEYHFCLECPEKYRNLSEKHVMCVKLNGTCVETEDIRPMKKLLDYHNMIRNMGPPFNFNLPAAADMLKMEWDEELFEMAKRYALQCPDSPDCQNCFRSDRFPVKQKLRN